MPSRTCCGTRALHATETSQAAGAAFLKRFRLRRESRDPEVNEKVAPAQIEALSKWGAPREKPYDYLNAIQQPTLVDQRRQRRDHLHHQLVHPAAEHP